MVMDSPRSSGSRPEGRISCLRRSRVKTRLRDGSVERNAAVRARGRRTKSRARGSLNQEAGGAEVERKPGRALVREPEVTGRGGDTDRRQVDVERFHVLHVVTLDGRPRGRTPPRSGGLTLAALARRWCGRLMRNSCGRGDGRIHLSRTGHRRRRLARRAATTRGRRPIDAAGGGRRCRLRGAGRADFRKRQHAHNRREGDQENMRAWTSVAHERQASGEFNWTRSELQSIYHADAYRTSSTAVP